MRFYEPGEPEPRSSEPGYHTPNNTNNIIIQNNIYKENDEKKLFNFTKPLTTIEDPEIFGALVEQVYELCKKYNKLDWIKNIELIKE